MATVSAFAGEVDLSLKVNGEPVRKRVEANRHLIDFLRLDLELTGSHVGCEQGMCGACTVRVNGEIVRGCLLLAAQLQDAEVWTIEGLTENGELSELQQDFVERNALQCGFCTPAMLITAAELLSRNSTPSREEIREHISGNYCRCTGYEAIVDAVETAARRRSASARRGEAE